MKKFSKGFTLAEVLITLAVIGVVAALTMPVIYAKIERNILNNQFKKMYSTLSIALESAGFDTSYSVDCYYIQNGVNSDGNRFDAPAENRGCKDFFYNNIAEKLRTVKICETNSFENGCLPDYNWPEKHSGCNPFASDNMKKKGAIVLNDGSIIFQFNDSHPIIGFDVNGKKGPNKPGFDVYAMTIRKVNNILKFASYSNDEDLYITDCLPDGGVTHLGEIMK